MAASNKSCSKILTPQALEAIYADKDKLALYQTYTTYQLEIDVNKAVTLSVGRLGCRTFPKGRYFYTGSAKRNLFPRLMRHLKKEKKLRWHIDYLLTRPEACVKRVLLSQQSECELNQNTRGEIFVSGFGASDCKQRCGGHLKKYTT